MRILIAHTYYQRRGGEDAVFENEADMLERRGHTVIRHIANNSSIEGLAEKARAFTRVTWNPAAAREVAAVIERERPQILHVHNFFPLMSPAIYDAARRAGVGVVQTLHNYRLGCASGFLTRQGEACELCVGKLPLGAIRHRCYRDSLAGSLAVAGMIAVHAQRGTWRAHVDRFIALTCFARDKLVGIGVPAGKIMIKPNFVPDCGPPPVGERNGALCVGRLSVEKGVLGLVRAWSSCEAPLAIAGGGPQEAEIRAVNAPCIEHLGHLSAEALAEVYRRVQVVVLPSIAYESMPMTLLEAWSHGLPVVAFRHSAFAEMIEDGVTGLLAPPGDFHALMERVRWALANPHAVADMGRAARAHYESHFTEDANYGQLLAVYRAASADAAARTAGKAAS